MRRGEVRQGEVRSGEARRGEVRRGEARRGEHGEARRREATRGEGRRGQVTRGETRRGEPRRQARGWSRRREQQQQRARLPVSRVCLPAIRLPAGLSFVGKAALMHRIIIAGEVYYVHLATETSQFDFPTSESSCSSGAADDIAARKRTGPLRQVA